jgi:hypothetical protein
MKSFLALFLSLTLVAFAADLIAGERGYVAGDKEELYGTWINTAYTGIPPQKFVIKSDGTFKYFGLTNSIIPRMYGKYLITGKWKYPQGDTWYKYHMVNRWDENYTLLKMSKSGSSFEMVYEQEAYPKEIDPKSIYYRSYTRK